MTDTFRIYVIANADVRSPIVTLGGNTFFYLRHDNLFLVAVTKVNANAPLVFEFLFRLINLGKSYFGDIFNEAVVKSNFVLLYELLDEINDFGYPQNTDPESLKLYITTETFKSEKAVSNDSSQITIQATGAIPWRRENLKYRKNEAFVDVIENVDMMMSSSGTVLRAEVNGQIKMRANLSGMPECSFGLNDSLTIDDFQPASSGLDHSTKASRAAAGTVSLEDCQFHQCVKLSKFEQDKTVHFIPPDGEFELMRYRAVANVSLPFRVHPIVTEVGNSKVEYEIALKANFSQKLYASNVIIRIPTPLNTTSVKCHSQHGKARYESSDNLIEWRIARLSGGSDSVLSAEATLTSMTQRKIWSRPPITLDFSILMFTSSGLLVQYLKVFEKSGYSSVKWVKYETRGGTYQIRF